MRRIHYTALLVGLAGLLALPAAAATQSAKDSAAPATVTVSGTGTVADTPQLSIWSFGVETRAATASGAFAATSASMRKVIAALKAAGVAAADLQTQQVSLSTAQSQDGTTTSGYQAANSVSVTVRDTERTGTIVDAAVGAGAVNVSGPSFSTAGNATLYRKALVAALDDALAKAQILAAKAGAKLGRMTSITEQPAGGPIVFAQGASMSRAADTPIEPGQSQTAATVTVTFELS